MATLPPPHPDELQKPPEYSPPQQGYPPQGYPPPGYPPQRYPPPGYLPPGYPPQQPYYPPAPGPQAFRRDVAFFPCCRTLSSSEPRSRRSMLPPLYDY
ncbi:uncharacterized protein LOC134187327 isoform X3 [Corticium candelabrum]|uniref:uncharacterized protein LOC134187327 isoform X3 n=1 Tax=Corticium candelabrum TaxID=121492 RepID=UPI002E275DA5|nr:uncharacterized protein LOC134187327 isoform X3 [Corticium candelabrum]